MLKSYLTIVLLLVMGSGGLLLMGCEPGASEAAARAGAVDQPDTTQQRYVEGQVLVSTDLPAIRVRLDEAFAYVGEMAFTLKDIARVERYVFVDVDEQQRIERMFIFQFEGFLDNNDHTYRYRFTNPVQLGGHTFNHNTWYYDDAAEIARNPGAESERTRAFLEEQGYHLEQELMMSRFVAVVDEARRNELILFYFENVRDTGYTLAEIATKEGDIAPEHTALDDSLTYRSRQHFTATADGRG